MKRIIILFFMLLSTLSHAHDGDDHGNASETAATGAAYFSSEAFSDKYELLIKYAPITAGSEGILRLFISNYNTNQPVDSASLQLSISGNANIKLQARRLEPGIYELKGTFPENQNYNIAININGPLGADLLLCKDIAVGKELPSPTTAPGDHVDWYQSGWFYAALGLIVGLLLMYLFMKKRNRKVTSAFLVVLCLVPSARYYSVNAHDGHDEASGKAGALSSAFIVEKESQFLFDIVTEKVSMDNLQQSIEVLGTVVPSPQGRAVIQSPQTGKIVSLRVNVGQRVSAGQVLAVVEQQIDAGTQIDILAQKNTVDAEYNAARAQYERLKSIEDIAAKKDITEAKARLETATRNKQLFDANANRNLGSTKMIPLTAPISGVVGTFNYSIGAVVNAGETLFDITNLDKVYIEAQVFSSNIKELKDLSRVTALSNNSTDTTQYVLKPVSTAQTVSEENQAQRLIFEVARPNGQFKIGENVSVRLFTNILLRQVVIPAKAVTDVNGKAAIFIKDKAEQYSISYIAKGESNNQQVSIIKGVEEGERVVISNVYQMKTIYLNQ